MTKSDITDLSTDLYKISSLKLNYVSEERLDAYREKLVKCVLSGFLKSADKPKNEAVESGDTEACEEAEKYTAPAVPPLLMASTIENPEQLTENAQMSDEDFMKDLAERIANRPSKKKPSLGYTYG